MSLRGWRTALCALGLSGIVGCSTSAGANNTATITDLAPAGGTVSGVTTTSIPFIAALPTTPTTSSTTTTSTSTTTTTIGPPIALDVGPPSAVGLIASNADWPQILTVDDIIQRCRALWPGSNRSIAMSVSRHGQFVAAWTVGTTARGNAIDLNARFRIASMSKLLTSLATMRLVEQGLIQLDIPFMQQYVTDIDPVDSRFDQITPRQLLTHTSGLNGLRGSFFRSNVENWYEAVEVAFDRDLLSAPGGRFFYSNANFVLLGALIEQQAGVSYEEAVHQLVLTPLGIATAELVDTEEQPEGDPGYVVTPGRLYMEALGPAGGWVMSANDATRMMAAFDPTFTPALLTADSITAMRTWIGIQSDVPDKYQYGLGLMLVTPGTYVGHTGTIESVRSFVLLVPNGYALTVLSSSEKTVSSGSTMIDYFRAEIEALARLP